MQLLKRPPGSHKTERGWLIVLCGKWTRKETRWNSAKEVISFRELIDHYLRWSPGAGGRLVVCRNMRNNVVPSSPSTCTEVMGLLLLTTASQLPKTKQHLQLDYWKNTYLLSYLLELARKWRNHTVSVNYTVFSFSSDQVAAVSSRLDFLKQCLRIQELFSFSLKQYGVTCKFEWR